MLHAGTTIEFNAKINSRGNKEQHATISKKKTKARRKGVIITDNKHLTRKTHTTVNYFEFY